jgi:hypothetical protein
MASAPCVDGRVEVFDLLRRSSDSIAESVKGLLAALSSRGGSAACFFQFCLKVRKLLLGILNGLGVHPARNPGQYTAFPGFPSRRVNQVEDLRLDLGNIGFDFGHGPPGESVTYSVENAAFS